MSLKVFHINHESCNFYVYLVTLECDDNNDIVYQALYIVLVKVIKIAQEIC